MPSTEHNTGAQEVDEQNYWSDVSYIAEKVAEKRCILFLGSAIHAAAPATSHYQYPPNKCPLIGTQLSELLADKSGYPDDDLHNLQRVAWHYESKRVFRHRLINEVRDAVHTGREPSPVLRGLVRLGFPLVITTNYDQLYEQALHQVARERARAAGMPEDQVAQVLAEFDKCVYSKNRGKELTKDCAKDPSSERPYLLKIHGDIFQDESIVITDEDYIQFVLRMTDKPKQRPIGEIMLTHLKRWPTLFIGYSLRDYNLRLLFKSLRWGLDDADIIPSYSVDFEPDVLIRDVWQGRRRYIKFIEKNLWEFVPDLYQAVTNQEMPQ